MARAACAHLEETLQSGCYTRQESEDKTCKSWLGREHSGDRSRRQSSGSSSLHRILRQPRLKKTLKGNGESNCQRDGSRGRMKTPATELSSPERRETNSQALSSDFHTCPGALAIHTQSNNKASKWRRTRSVCGPRGQVRIHGYAVLVF